MEFVQKMAQLDDYRRLPAGSMLANQQQQGSRNRILLVGVVVLLSAVGLYCLVSWVDRTRVDTLSDQVRSDALNALFEPPPDDWLLNVPHFDYEMNSVNACSGGRQPVYFLALIHSKAEHFRQRQVIRQTWATRRADLITPVFLLGLVRSNVSLDVQQLLDAEQSKYGDLVQGNFIDNYRNLTLKNLMGLKWATKYCPSARFILKSDDDAFIDVAQLRQFIERTWPVDWPENTLICSVHEEAPVQRTGKWAVALTEYARETYPAFCSGLAYVMRPQLADKLLRASRSGLTPALWIDDVYVTGILAKAVQARHFYLNLRYTHQQADVVEWLNDSTSKVLPYIVSELDTSRPDWRLIAEKLWNKTQLSITNEPSLR